MSKKKNNGNGNGHDVIKKDVTKKDNKVVIQAKTQNQKLFLKSVRDNTVTIVHGVCGTGKTRLAVLSALKAFKQDKYDKIIFTRPCIEANGESLGYLPGDLNEKIHPYMLPIFDFLSEYLDSNTINRYMKDNKIITLPLAYHRGLTFRNAFVIGDEFQNTTPEQVRMFLTRIGENCKVIITGDPRQTDISGKNGLVDAVGRLGGVKGLGIVEFTEVDILRNPIVIEIEKKYTNN